MIYADATDFSVKNIGLIQMDLPILLFPYTSEKIARMKV